MGIKKYFYQLIALEISEFSQYYDQIIDLGSVYDDSDMILEQISCPKKLKLDSAALSDLRQETDSNGLMLFNGLFNFHDDIQSLLVKLRDKISRTTRLVIVDYNSYVKWPYLLGNWLGLRKGKLPTTFLTHKDYECLAKLSGYEVVKSRSVVYFPFWFFGFGGLINFIFPLIPYINRLSMASIILQRFFHFPNLNEFDSSPRYTY